MKIDASWYTRVPGALDSVSAGGVVARQASGRVLIALVHEVGYPDLVLPKGHVEPGESLEAAALREVAEESGLTDLDLIQKLGECTRMNLRKTEWKTTHYFLFTTTQETGTPADAEHHYELVWTPIDDLSRLFWPDQRAIVAENRHAIVQAIDENRRARF